MSKRTLAAKPAGGRADKLKAYLQQNGVHQVAVLSDAAIVDLKFFEESFRRGEGKLSRRGVLRFLEEEHGIKISGQGLHTLCKRAGIAPWWTP